MLVSIVTPSLNQGRFLARTIDSVLAQTYPHVEYVVMDGGSRDESLDVLRSYGAAVTWVSEPDRGQADAINRGFARCHGQIRAYLNSDDVLRPDAVEKAVRHFEAHPQCDLVYGQAPYIDENDRVIGQYPTVPYSFDRLLTTYCICQPAAFWRTRVAERVGPFDDALHYVMDYEYWLRIARAGGQIEYLPDILAASRLYAETKTRSARPQIFAEIREVRRRHGGRLDPGYFFALWDHRINERGDGWPRRLRILPKAPYVVGFLDYLWQKAYGQT